MGSKRTKKSKEIELFSEKHSIRKNNESEDSSESEVTDGEDENNGVIQTVITKAPKRKKKNEGLEEVPKKVKRTNDDETESKKVKVKKRKTKSDSVTSNENEENEDQISVNGVNEIQMEKTFQKNIKNHNPDKKNEITWPDQDIIELINRMDSNIPDRDILAYRSRVEKLNWDNVAFKMYSAEECKETWLKVQKRIRRFRLLREILNDAKDWVTAPKVNNNVPRPRKHPDMPRRPLSSYLLFYLKKKDQIISENPGLDRSDITKRVGQIYKNLPPEQKEKYEKLAALKKEEYFEKWKVFSENHPEFVPPQKMNYKVEKEKPAKLEKEKFPKVEKEKTPKLEKEKTPKVEKEKVPKIDKEKPKVAKEKPKGERRPGRPPKADKNPGERPPKKCQTPFGLYYASELKNMEPGMEKSVFREKCKEQYKQMSDKKKIYWINLAEQDLIRYQEEVKAYKAKYPDFQVHKVRPILTKREKLSKERALGKPVKPPNSAYALYSRVMLQSEGIKTVHPKDRMNYIAGKWKNCPEEEQNVYRDQVIRLLEQYKQDYQTYLDSLPEEERRKLVTQSKRKGRKSGRASGRKPRKRKTPKKPQPTKLKFTEPEQPPISACKYFATLYKGESDPVQAWKALNTEEKRKYEEELVKKKQAYIVEFEKFLKSLSKEELEAFSRSRQQQVQSDDEESSECSSDSEGDDDDEDEDEENGEEVPNNEDGRDSETD
ncbi:hypothetical protein MTP99_019375 [Tenebrio molitor]|jgi:upstream-binding transcription factor|uniref:nucleolar transcription factor 1-A-like n=1 Tax=Tenebrio molitor TaxID=7067 RepID=UPI001C3A55F1|nr:hypothetical protein MTP99_019375 [Tenebrio molitor]CAH1377994.1 unnamed protein product [Tenebrio molitor]